MKNKKSLKDIIEKILEEMDEVKDFHAESLLQVLLTSLLNAIMRREREMHLEQVDDTKNGFYKRNFSIGSIPLILSIPRTRNSTFFPSILPKYSRTLPEEYRKLVEALLLSSRSIQSLKIALSELNLPYSQKEIEEITETLYQEFKAMNSRELASDWLVIFMDAKVLDVKNEKGEIKKAVLITATGIDMSGKKNFLGSHLHYGNETLEAWKIMLENLSQRGVKRVLLWVTDNFPGISKLIKSFFPLSMHQLCIVHLIRNAKYRLKKELYKRFREIVEMAGKAENFEEAEEIFSQGIDLIRKDHPHFAKELERNQELYLTFTKFPREIRARIKSTNASENLHKELDKIRINSGGYFQSEKILWVKWYIYLDNLQNNSWQKPEPVFKAHLQTLHLMFRKTFETEEINHE